jgi:hypothetical protein
LISVLKFTEKTVCVFDIINDGFADGMRLGFAEGLALGIADGLLLGLAEGLVLGIADGLLLGFAEGLALGIADGLLLGFADGLALGIADGLAFSFVNLRLVIFSVSDSMMVASLKLSLLETFSNGSVVLVISMISNKV